MKNKKYPNGWWILPMALLGGLFICALLVALLLPHANTGNGAFAVIVISFVTAVIGGMLSLRAMR